MDASFPGAIGVSHLRVYDTPAPDGLAGGTPHLHTVCSEAYVVLAGAGEVQTLTTAGFRTVPLEPGALVWFTAGTIHRLINRGGLEIVVLMANAGLPEAGDMVITMPPETIADSEAYAAAATLPPGHTTTLVSDEAARRRRDLAVPVFNGLVGATEAGDLAPLLAFHAAAAALVQPRLDRWESIWRDGPLAAASATGAALEALAHRDVSYFGDASVRARPAPTSERRYGCCGTLGTYVAG